MPILSEVQTSRCHPGVISPQLSQLLRRNPALARLRRVAKLPMIGPVLPVVGKSAIQALHHL
jgi:hypothetical protein